MGHAPLPALAVAAALAACTAMPGTGPVPGPSRAGSDVCVPLFQQFDVLEALYPDNKSRYEGRVARPPVEAQAQRLRIAGCMTLTRDLTPMEATIARAAEAPGAAIVPVSLHAGVVTNMADDARSRSFFSREGVPVRTVGSAPLGRRVYLGPFATQGALDSARDLAFRAGFAHPYPADF